MLERSWNFYQKSWIICKICGFRAFTLVLGISLEIWNREKRWSTLTISSMKRCSVKGVALKTHKTKKKLFNKILLIVNCMVHTLVDLNVFLRRHNKSFLDCIFKAHLQFVVTYFMKSPFLLLQTIANSNKTRTAHVSRMINGFVRGFVKLIELSFNRSP